MRTVARGVLVVLVGCGGNGLPLEIDTTQDNVCDQIAEVACFDMYQCCSEGEIESMLMVGHPRTVTDCQADLRTRCERQIVNFDRSLKTKRVRFDSNAMNACLKEFVAPSACVTVGAAKPWAEPCMTSAWVGIVEVGGACDFPYECVKDSVCAPNRTCTALPTENMPCTAQGCATGLFCDDTAVGGPVCHALIGAGTACTSNTQCQSGLICAGICQPPFSDGSICSNSLECASSLCLTGTCSATGLGCINNVLCLGQCSNDSNPFHECATALDCDPGLCISGPELCYSDQNCFLAGLPAPYTCVNPPTCNPDQCVGNFCEEQHLTVDYCTNVLTDLPLLGADHVSVGAAAN